MTNEDLAQGAIDAFCCDKTGRPLRAFVADAIDESVSAAIERCAALVLAELTWLQGEIEPGDAYCACHGLAEKIRALPGAPPRPTSASETATGG
jgi:hypothetical protein